MCILLKVRGAASTESTRQPRYGLARCLVDILYR